MKASKLLQLYADGVRDFQSLDLKGQSFKGKDLSGANFSQSDIRGADFSGATLRDTNFSAVQAGIQPHDAIALAIVLCLLAALLGGLAGLVDTVAELEFHTSQLVDYIPKWLTLGVLIGFACIAVRNGLAASFTVFILAFIAAGVMALLSSAAVIAAGAIAIAITLASFVAVATTILVVITLAATIALNQAIAIATLVIFGVPFLFIAVPSAGGSAIGLAITVIVLSANISWRALKGDRQHAPIVELVLTLLSRLGTRFRAADLTKADFTDAKLRCTDFSDANLTRVYWGLDTDKNKQMGQNLLLNQ
ncbi:MAG: hypothetical protein Kow00121_48750 [Elainellaceae cyanobacterium]